MTDVMGERGFDELLADRHGLLDAPHYRAQVEAIAGAIVTALRAHKKVLWCGNGGSAAEAQHMAAELSGRFLRERPGLHSEALSVNSSALTCIGNDYGYDRIFSRQVEAFAHPGDVVIGMTTSGRSSNVVRALEAAKKCGAVAVAFTGNGGGRVAEIADLALIGPDGYAAIVQEVHQVMAHIVCDLVEQRLIFEDGIAGD
jgi:D-sedoheptulose 7-phosphate isomerase